MTIMHNGHFLEAIQFYGDSNTGYDGEYSVRTKWLNHVIQETKDNVTVKLNNSDYVILNKNDWIIYDPAKYQVIDICNDYDFNNKYV